MSGLDEARLAAYVDGELDPGDRAEVDAWLEESPAAREALEAVRGRRSLVTGALNALDAPAPAVAEARTRVRSSLEPLERGMRRDGGDVVGAAASTAGSGSTREGGSGGWLRRSRLARAAGVVLLLGAAGVSAAVPGSPVRAWLESALGEDERVAVTVGPEAQANAGAAAGDMGVRVRPANGRIEIALSGVPAGRDVVVHLVDDDQAAVYAPRASFRSGAGRIDAAMEGGEGPVRIEIPRTVAVAALRVDGRLYLEKRGERLGFPGPEARVSADTIRFGGAG